jgi:hypothetical protein
MGENSLTSDAWPLKEPCHEILNPSFFYLNLRALIYGLKCFAYVFAEKFRKIVFKNWIPRECFPWF